MKEIGFEGQMNIFDSIRKPVTFQGIGAYYRYFTERWNMIDIAIDQCAEWIQEHDLPQEFYRVYGNPERWKSKRCYGCRLEPCHEAQGVHCCRQCLDKYHSCSSACPIAKRST